MNEQEVFFKTGCLTSCHKDNFRVAEYNDKRMATQKSKAGTMFDVVLFHANARYYLMEHYVIYDHNSFIADVGGYLGLLLGHSILSIYTQFSNKIREI